MVRRAAGSPLVRPLSGALFQTEQATFINEPGDLGGSAPSRLNPALACIVWRIAPSRVR
jgi:hypothetical protein